MNIKKLNQDQNGILLPLIFIGIVGVFVLIGFIIYRNTASREYKKPSYSSSKQDTEKLKDTEKIFFKDNNIDTSDWQTHTSEDWKFSFKYPKTDNNFIWTASDGKKKKGDAYFEEGSLGSGAVGVKSKEKIVGDGFTLEQYTYGVFRVYVAEIDSYMDQGAISNQSFGGDNSAETLGSTKPKVSYQTQIDGYEADCWESDSKVSGEDFYVIECRIVKDDKAFYLTVKDVREKDSVEYRYTKQLNYLEIGTEIIRSFKFN